MEPFVAYLLAGIVIVLIGVLSIIKGLQKKKRCTASAVAMIVEVEKDDDVAGREGTRKKYTYTPIYEFAADGKTIRKSGNIYSHKKENSKLAIP